MQDRQQAMTTTEEEHVTCRRVLQTPDFLFLFFFPLFSGRPCASELNVNETPPPCLSLTSDAKNNLKFKNTYFTEHPLYSIMKRYKSEWIIKIFFDKLVQLLNSCLKGLLKGQSITINSRSNYNKYINYEAVLTSPLLSSNGSLKRSLK